MDSLSISMPEIVEFVKAQFAFSQQGFSQSWLFWAIFASFYTFVKLVKYKIRKA